MLNTELEKNILKKTLILIIILSICSLFFGNRYYIVICGLTVGSGISIFRLCLMTSSFSKVTTNQGKYLLLQSLLTYALRQIFTFLIFVFAIKFSIKLFFGIVLGVLIVPLIIMIDGILNNIWIKKNNLS